MNGTFYIVGVGPGDPELITLKAIRILEKCSVWLTPAARVNGNSTALGIASGTIDPKQKTILHHHFPMKKVHMGEKPDAEVKAAWEKAAQLINEQLQAGHDVALPTLGDPAIYCTGFYVYETLLTLNPHATVRIIPGISAIGATAAAANIPLCLGDDRVAVIPAIFESDTLKEIIQQFEAVVFMKVYKAMDRLVPLLEELDLLDHAVLVEQTSMEGQRVHHDVKETLGKELHYFSTLLVRRS
jgi:precorrin-2/cobalt-factor-2 C20-methyltransferase